MYRISRKAEWFGVCRVAGKQKVDRAKPRADSRLDATGGQYRQAPWRDYACCFATETSRNRRHISS